MLTGVSTLWLAEAIRGTPSHVDLWLPPGGGPRPSRPARVTRGARPDGDPLQILAGLPSLSYERAVCDLATTATIDQLVRAIAALDRLRLASYGAIGALAAQRGRFPGVGKLRAAIAVVEDDLNHSDADWWIDRFTTDEVERTPHAFVAAVRRGLEAARRR